MVRLITLTCAWRWLQPDRSKMCGTGSSTRSGGPRGRFGSNALRRFAPRDKVSHPVPHSRRAVTNGTFHVARTRARVRLWRPRPRTSITACSAKCLKKNVIVKNIVVPARAKSTFVCAATDFTIALHADRRVATKSRSRTSFRPGSRAHS